MGWQRDRRGWHCIVATMPESEHAENWQSPLPVLADLVGGSFQLEVPGPGRGWAVPPALACGPHTGWVTTNISVTSRCQQWHGKANYVWSSSNGRCMGWAVFISMLYTTSSTIPLPFTSHLASSRPNPHLHYSVSFASSHFIVTPLTSSFLTLLHYYYPILSHFVINSSQRLFSG